MVSALPRWRRPHPLLWPPTPTPTNTSRRQRRKYQRLLRRHNRPPSHFESIRTARLHRKYPLNLRYLGHFVQRSQAPTLEEQRVRYEIEDLRKLIQNLQSEVRWLKRNANRRDTQTANRHQPTDPQHVPGLRREGGNWHDSNVRGTGYDTHRGTRRSTVNDIGMRHRVPSGPGGPSGRNGGPSGQIGPNRRQTVNRAHNIPRSPATTAPIVPDDWTVPPHRHTPAQSDRSVSLHRSEPYGMP
jgi:hypothetical protein